MILLYIFAFLIIMTGLTGILLRPVALRTKINRLETENRKFRKLTGSLYSEATKYSAGDDPVAVYFRDEIENTFTEDERRKLTDGK